MTEFPLFSGSRFALLGWLAPALLTAPLGAAQTTQAPPVPVAYLNVDATSSLSVPVHSRAGVASMSSTVNGFDVLQAGGVSGGTYRTNTRMYETTDMLLAYHVRDAKEAGMQALVTVLGTPEDLQTPGNGVTYMEWSIPPFARTVPSSYTEWADRVVARLDDMMARTGVLPDYVELWNEIDRQEFWEGTLQQYLDLYSVAATRIRAAYPQVKVGGPGLAGQFSTLEGTESALDALARHCAQYSVPLDFLSWHHYTEANELDLTGVVPRLRGLTSALGLNGVELIVSEWNIWSNLAEEPIAFDDSRAASQMAGFMTTAIQAGLDRNTYFQMFDLVLDPNEPMLDLQGAHMGAITVHGIKKPVAHVLSFIATMLDEQVLKTGAAPKEYGARVLASRTTDRMVLLVSNDEVEPKWLWVEKCRLNGILAGELWERLMAAANQVGVAEPTAQQLAATGLVSLYEAEFSLDVLTDCQVLEAAEGQVREVRVHINNLTAHELENGRIGKVLVFDSTRNNPTLNVSQIQAALAAAEQAGIAHAYQDTADYLVNAWGLPATGPALAQTGIEPWVLANGGTGATVFNAELTMREAIINRRMEGFGQWDQHPATRLNFQSSHQAGVTFDRQTRELVFQMEPNSVTLVELSM